ncbi:MAG: acyl-CoA dehydrogenase family protein [Alphaproteobacteria bacterium]|jgi:acyl-CoA dehydrogenase|nr:acyl-CoA dehydrogenase family protein [Alphaproteobacteria bacterium]
MDFTIDDELKALQRDVRRMVDEKLRPHDATIETEGRIPDAALDAIRQLGLFGSHTPARYGGLGLDMLGNCLVIMEMARAHIAYFYTYSMNVHIASKCIELHGSEAQRRRWLPDLASGRAIGCYALTEEQAGSDAAAAETTATLDGEAYVLNGRKRYITNAPIADLFTVFAATGPGQGATGALAAFVIERQTPGLEIGDVFEMAGGRGAHHAEVVFNDCRVSLENRLGDEGDGFAIAMAALDAGRINWAAYCVGAAQSLVDMTLEHLTSRRQFGRPLADNQGIQWMLADMTAELHAARLVCYEAALNYEDDPDNRPLNGARAKLIASEMVGRIADQAVQLFGGAGYRKDLPIERIWREVRAIRILEGTSEIMRHIIARDTLRAARRRNSPGSAGAPSRARSPAA